MHVLRLAPHRTMMLVLQEEGGGIVGVHQPQAHGASVHAGENHRVGLEGGPGIVHILHKFTMMSLARYS